MMEKPILFSKATAALVVARRFWMDCKQDILEIIQKERHSRILYETMIKSWARESYFRDSIVVGGCGA